METLWTMMRDILRAVVIRDDPGAETTWDVLFVSAQGRVVRIRDFKRHAAMLLLLLLAALLAAFCLLLLYTHEKNEVDRLQTDLATSRQNITDLVDENDALLAQIVVLQQKAVAVPSGEPPAGESTENTEMSSTPAAASDHSGISASPPVPVPPIAVDDLSVVMTAGTEQLKIRFSINKIDSDREYVSGHMFVMLKNSNDENLFQMVPAVPVTDGRPTRINSGQFFSIARYKPVVMSTRTEANPEDFNRATVLIFTPEGERLFEKTFDITIVTIVPKREPADDKTDQHPQEEAAETPASSPATATAAEPPAGETPVNSRENQ